MIVTDTDRRVIDFVTKMNCVTTKTIAELFYPSLRYAQHRLKLMAESKVLKRDREHFTNQYYYYIDKKPKQVYHNILLADFYKELSKIAKIEVFKKEFTIEDIRPDALVVYTKNNQSYIAFVEIELSNTPNIGKYENLYKKGLYKKYFNGVFPLIIYVTNKKIPKTNLKVFQVNEKIENLKGVLI